MSGSEIEVECVECGSTGDVPAWWGGRTVECKECGAMMLVGDSIPDDASKWVTARKKPVEVKFCGPFTDTDTIETIEGDFEVDEEYIEKHDGYVIIEGVEGERYPCGLDIFEETYEIPSP